MSKPSGGENLEDDAAHLAWLGITHVVSMLERDEAWSLELELEEEVLKLIGIGFTGCPVPDHSIPTDLPGFCESVGRTHERLLAGAHVVVHCRAGIGRSGLYTAAVLLVHGTPRETVFSTVSEARGLTVPDTQEQFDWFAHHADSILRQTKR